MIKRFAPALLLVFLCGCFQVKDELTIQPDGSGTVRLETTSLLPSEMLGQAMGQSVTPVYPPSSPRTAYAFFPDKDFVVKVNEKPGSDSATITVIEAAFKDINALLASPYGRAHGLTLKIENGVFSLKAVSGMEGLARMANMKDDTGEMGMAMANLGEMSKKTNEMRFEFHVTLPNTVSAANGVRDGKSVKWVVERAKVKDGEEYANQLSSSMEASCPADSLKMTPVTPQRLVSTPFKDLRPGTFAAASTLPDVKKIEQAVKFVPLALHVTRSLDLTGEGGGSRENMAELIGQVTVPNEFAPQKWGESKLEEAVDAKGTSLVKNGDSSERFLSGMRFRSESDDGEADGSEEKAVDAKDQKHLIQFAFQPPDWKVKEIAKIKGSVDLQYYGGSQLLTVSNAIPENWIIDQKASRNVEYSEKTISDPKLSEAGLTLEFASGMVQSGMTSLSLVAGGANSAVTDLQVFDSSGKPWPSIWQKSEMDERASISITIPGRPKTPLSLALVVSGTGTNVTVPIILEHIPVTGK